MRWLRLAFLVALVAVAWWLVERDDAETDPQPTARPSSASTSAPSPSAPVPSGPVTRLPLATAIDRLPVAAEDRQTYRRALFGTGWADADGDCRDTRAEVLARDSEIPVPAGCRVLRGRWTSAYDGRVWTESHQVQVDHLVPLAEAWDSGALRVDAGDA